MASIFLTIILTTFAFQSIYGSYLRPENPLVQLTAPIMKIPLKLTQMSTKVMGSNNPLIEKFATKFTDHFTGDPGKSVLFKPFTLPFRTSEFSNEFSNSGLLKNLMPNGSSESDSNATESEFGNWSPMSMMKSLGFAQGSNLFQNGFLKEDNFSSLSKTFFEDMMSGFTNLKDKGMQSWIQVVIDACVKFCSRFGMNWTDGFQDFSKFGSGGNTK